MNCSVRAGASGVEPQPPLTGAGLTSCPRPSEGVKRGWEARDFLLTTPRPRSLPLGQSRPDTEMPRGEGPAVRLGDPQPEL